MKMFAFCWALAGMLGEYACFRAKEAEEKHVNELEEGERLNQQQRRRGFAAVLLQ